MSQFKIGSRCETDNLKGTIKYYGTTEFASVGRNSGWVSGVKYFECKPRRGVFVRPSLIINPNKTTQLPQGDLKTRLKKHQEYLLQINETIQFNENRILQLQSDLKEKGSKGKDCLTRIGQFEKRARLIRLLQNKKLALQFSKAKKQKIKSQIKTRKKTTQPPNTFFSQITQKNQRKIDKLKIQLNFEKKKTDQSILKKNKLELEYLDLKDSVQRKRNKFQKNIQQQKQKIIELELSKKKIQSQLTSNIIIPKENVKEYEEQIRKLSQELTTLQNKLSFYKISGRLIRTTGGSNHLNVPLSETKYNWIPKIYKIHPKLLIMRERLRCLNKNCSYSRYYRAERFTNSSIFTNETISHLIMNYYDAEQSKPQIIETIENSLGYMYNKQIIKNMSQNQDESLFRSLIRFSLQHPRQIWEDFDGEKEGIWFTESENARQFQSFSNLIKKHQQEQNQPIYLPVDDVSIWNEPDDNENNIQLDLEMLNRGISHKNNLFHTICSANINKLIERLSWNQSGQALDDQQKQNNFAFRNNKERYRDEEEEDYEKRFENGGDDDDGDGDGDDDDGGDDEIDNLEYIKAILITYPRWITAQNLFLKIVQAYNGPFKGSLFVNSNKIIDLSQIQNSLIIVLKIWIKDYWYDIPKRITESISQFIQTKVCSFFPKKGKLLLNLLEKVQKDSYFKKTPKKYSANKKINTDIRSPTGPPPNPKIPKNIFSEDFDIFDLSPIEFARQLTLYCYQNYLNINSSEIINGSWSKGHEKYKAPNVLKVIAKSNHLSGLFIESILNKKKVSERTQQMEYILEIGKHCLQLNNIDGVMIVLASVGHSSIRRLEQTKNGLSNSSKDLFQQFITLTEKRGNWKNLRKFYDEAKLPVTPWIGTFLTDLTFIYDGTKDMLDSKINFGKIKLVYQTIDRLLSFQKISYNLAYVDQIQVIFEKCIIKVDSENWYNISLQREPRK
ncbi:guanine nucleotide exchange factor [Anaeramoeba flamelloides]|uniref:Guanine nucleotide exchange factor n=1 Tax=Anaeramoeba flamelloides TaxID=1746091 RepID=A0ABQ8YVZ9_9EUKA|nr:guanine nucleotide exchange factor [Anaeramoeba flamelloides]